MLISTTPKQKPAGRVVSTSVRTPLERSAPIAPWVPASGSGVHVRDGRRETNSAVPVSTQAALSASAAIGETAATIAAAISGPAVNSTSIATLSSAKAADSSSSRRRSSSGHSARSAEPMFGMQKPPASPHATSAAVGAPPSVSAISTPVQVTSSSASGSRIRRWPKRSIQRLCTGTPSAAPIPNAPSTRPATA